MPYIDAEARDRILDSLGIAHDSAHNVRPKNVERARFLTPGELNFAISALMHEYVMDHGLNYGVMSEAYAQAVCAAAEFYRTVLAPYENQKRAENGRVSGLEGQ